MYKNDVFSFICASKCSVGYLGWIRVLLLFWWTSHHFSNHEVEELVGQRVVWTTEASHSVPTGLGHDAGCPIHFPAQTHTHTNSEHYLWLMLFCLVLYLCVCTRFPVAGWDICRWAARHNTRWSWWRGTPDWDLWSSNPEESTRSSRKAAAQTLLMAHGSGGKKQCWVIELNLCDTHFTDSLVRQFEIIFMGDLNLTSVVFWVVLLQRGHSLIEALVKTSDQSDGRGSLSPAHRVGVRPRPNCFLQFSWETKSQEQWDKQKKHHLHK